MLTDTRAFSPEARAVSRVARALAHPARIAILRLLSERHTCVCGEVVDALPLAQATVSGHLRILREAGLVRGTIDGPRSCYCLDPEGVADAQERLADLFGELARAPTPDQCC